MKEGRIGVRDYSNGPWLSKVLVGMPKSLWHVCVGVSAVTLSCDSGTLEVHYLIPPLVNTLQVDFFDPPSHLAFKDY